MSATSAAPITPLSVTVPEATRLLGFKDPKSTYNLIHEGKIKARKSGRIFLVSYQSLVKYVEGRENDGDHEKTP